MILFGLTNYVQIFLRTLTLVLNCDLIFIVINVLCGNGGIMRTTTEDTLRNDENIIAAAIKVFSEKGYDAASMQDIADEAKISRGPLYYRYKTKKDIFLAAMDAYAEHELELQAETLQQNKPFSEKIKNYLLFATKNIRNDKPEFPLEVFAGADMQDVNQQVREIYARAFRITKDCVQQAIQSGDLLPETDVDRFTNVLFAAFDGLRYSRLKTGIIATNKNMEETIEEICRLLVAGYGTK